VLGSSGENDEVIILGEHPIL